MDVTDRHSNLGPTCLKIHQSAYPPTYRSTYLLIPCSPRALSDDQDGDGKFSRDEVRAMASDFIKEKKTRRRATKAVIAMSVVVLLVVGLNAGLTAAIVFISKDTEVDGSGRIMVAGTDTPATIENPHITTRTLTSLTTVAGEETRSLSEAPATEVLVDAYGGAIAVAPLTNEANTLISACAKRTSNSQLPPPAFTSRFRNVAPPSIYAPRLSSRTARSSALIPSLPTSIALSQTPVQHAPRTAAEQPRAYATASQSPHRARRAAHVPGRVGQPVKTAPLTNEANTMLSACATPSSNLACF